MAFIPFVNLKGFKGYIFFNELKRYADFKQLVVENGPFDSCGSSNLIVLSI